MPASDVAMDSYGSGTVAITGPPAGVALSNATVDADADAAVCVSPSASTVGIKRTRGPTSFL
jgi:hypothetical protein